jgi:dephospho-CoA kinase
MLIVGLTGGIATGKSTVTEMFRERGVVILDFDVMSRDVVEPDTPAWHDIVAHFGESILSADRTLDRAKIGDIVFPDAEERKKLEGFIYPRLFEEYNRLLSEIEEADPDALVLVDTPLLFEAKLEGMFGKILVVYATRELQIERLTERDGLDMDAVLARIDAQMPTEEKLEGADYVIRNCGSLEGVERAVEEILADLKNSAA